MSDPVQMIKKNVVLLRQFLTLPPILYYTSYKYGLLIRRDFTHEIESFHILDFLLKLLRLHLNPVYPSGLLSPLNTSQPTTRQFIIKKGD